MSQFAWMGIFVMAVALRAQPNKTLLPCEQSIKLTGQAGLTSELVLTHREFFAGEVIEGAVWVRNLAGGSLLIPVLRRDEIDFQVLKRRTYRSAYIYESIVDYILPPLPSPGEVCAVATETLAPGKAIHSSSAAYQQEYINSETTGSIEMTVRGAIGPGRAQARFHNRNLSAEFAVVQQEVLSAMSVIEQREIVARQDFGRRVLVLKVGSVYVLAIANDARSLKDLAEESLLLPKLEREEVNRRWNNVALHRLAESEHPIALLDVSGNNAGIVREEDLRISTNGREFRFVEVRTESFERRKAFRLGTNGTGIDWKILR